MADSRLIDVGRPMLETVDEAEEMIGACPLPIGDCRLCCRRVAAIAALEAGGE